MFSKTGKQCVRWTIIFTFSLSLSTHMHNIRSLQEFLLHSEILSTSPSSVVFKHPHSFLITSDFNQIKSKSLTFQKENLWNKVEKPSGNIFLKSLSTLWYSGWLQPQYNRSFGWDYWLSICKPSPTPSSHSGLGQKSLEEVPLCACSVLRHYTLTSFISPSASQSWVVLALFTGKTTRLSPTAHSKVCLAPKPTTWRVLGPYHALVQGI